MSIVWPKIRNSSPLRAGNARLPGPGIVCQSKYVLGAITGLTDCQRVAIGIERDLEGDYSLARNRFGTADDRLFEPVIAVELQDLGLDLHLN